MLRKIGNSVGMTVPASILGKIGASAEAPLDLRVEGRRIVVTPVQTERRGGRAAAAA